MNKNNTITIHTTVKAPIKKIWEYWTLPKHITNWAFATPEWEAPSAKNDLKVGEKFKTRMQAKDGSEGFDFTGTYTKIIEHKLIEYTMDDDRKVKTMFEDISGSVKITTTFEAENVMPQEVQRAGWQAILDNFKKYCENNTKV